MDHPPFVGLDDSIGALRFLALLLTGYRRVRCFDHAWWNIRSMCRLMQSVVRVSYSRAIRFQIRHACTCRAELHGRAISAANSKHPSRIEMRAIAGDALP